MTKNLSPKTEVSRQKERGRKWRIVGWADRLNPQKPLRFEDRLAVHSADISDSFGRILIIKRNASCLLDSKNRPIYQSIQFRRRRSRDFIVSPKGIQFSNGGVIDFDFYISHNIDFYFHSIQFLSFIVSLV